MTWYRNCFQNCPPVAPIPFSYETDMTEAVSQERRFVVSGSCTTCPRSNQQFLPSLRNLTSALSFRPGCRILPRHKNSFRGKKGKIFSIVYIFSSDPASRTLTFSWRGTGFNDIFLMGRKEREIGGKNEKWKKNLGTSLLKSWGIKADWIIFSFSSLSISPWRYTGKERLILFCFCFYSREGGLLILVPSSLPPPPSPLARFQPPPIPFVFFYVTPDPFVPSFLPSHPRSINPFPPLPHPLNRCSEISFCAANFAVEKKLVVSSSLD